MIEFASRKPKTAIVLFLFFVGFVVLGGRLLMAPAAMLNGALDVAQQEFAPKVMLKKYEWFKDASSKLVKLEADILASKSRIKNMEESYYGVPRKDWDRWDKQQMNLWQTELAGVKMVYNNLAAQYNAQSSKFNWAMFDKTDGDSLVKEFKGY